MQWVKMIDKRRLLLISLFIVAFLLTRLPNLGYEEANPDGVNWHYRSQQFYVGLKSQNWEKTYQHYHPGVTLMWISGFGIELLKQVTGIEVYTNYNFPVFNFMAKYFLISFQLLLSVYLCFLLSKVLGFTKAYLFTIIFNFEPFILGNSRLYHMDILFVLFILISLTLGYLHYSEKQMKWALLMGVFSGLAFLTRSLGIGILFFNVFFTIFFDFLKKRSFITALKLNYRGLFVSVFLFILTTFVLFPALWVKPVYIFNELLSEGQRVGLRKGHDQIILGEETTNASVIFYPLVTLIKSSPFAILGVITYVAFVIFVFKKGEISNQLKTKNYDYVGYITYSGLFFMGYILIMSLPSKKIDRYVITFFPFLSLLTAMALYKWHQVLKNKKLFVIISTFLFFILSFLPALLLNPYGFAYASPLVGGLNYANKLVAQKPFGLGIFEVRDYILNTYGEETLGFLDPKPIKAIYANSKVYDIRDYDPSNYRILVLASDESMSDRVLKSDKFIFNKVHTIYINKFPYWMIYERQQK